MCRVRRGRRLMGEGGIVLLERWCWDDGVFGLVFGGLLDGKVVLSSSSYPIYSLYLLIPSCLCLIPVVLLYISFES